jgi:hypothetical protein
VARLQAALETMVPRAEFEQLRQHHGRAQDALRTSAPAEALQAAEQQLAERAAEVGRLSAQVTGMAPRADLERARREATDLRTQAAAAASEAERLRAALAGTVPRAELDQTLSAAAALEARPAAAEAAPPPPPPPPPPSSPLLPLPSPPPRGDPLPAQPLRAAPPHPLAAAPAAAPIADAGRSPQQLQPPATPV